MDEQAIQKDRDYYFKLKSSIVPDRVLLITLNDLYWTKESITRRVDWDIWIRNYNFIIHGEETDGHGQIELGGVLKAKGSWNKCDDNFRYEVSKSTKSFMFYPTTFLDPSKTVGTAEMELE